MKVTREGDLKHVAPSMEGKYTVSKLLRFIYLIYLFLFLFCC